MSSKGSNLIDVGRVTGVFGVKGWLKVKSSTEPEENIVSYSPWWLKTRHGVKPVELAEYKKRNNDWIVRFEGIDDRDTAAELAPLNIAVEKSQLDDLEEGEFYWFELIGLKVSSVSKDSSVDPVDLGVVSKMLETGANDVLVVAPSNESIDDRERLIPYVPDQFILRVDLAEKSILVDWDTEF